MRVTSGIVANNILFNISKNSQDLMRLQDRLSSGRRINRPSDDPGGTVDALRLRTGIAESEVFASNAENGQSFLESTESALNEMTNLLRRARDLAVYAAGDTAPDQSRQAIALEIDELLEQAVQVANTTHGGKYLFSGTQTTTKPFTRSATGVDYNGNDEAINRQVGHGIRIQVNLPGSRLVGTADPFQVLINLKDSVLNDNAAGISARISEIEASIDHTLSLRAEVGARINRTEWTARRLEDEGINFEQLLSKVEDADLAETMVRFSVREAAYQASLAAGARIVQPSLMDFLR